MGDSRIFLIKTSYVITKYCKFCYNLCYNCYVNYIHNVNYVKNIKQFKKCMHCFDSDKFIVLGCFILLYSVII